MRSEFIDLISKIELCSREVATAANASENPDVESDLEKIITASTQFKDLINTIFENVSQDGTLSSVLSDSKIKHDLRTPLNAILGYSEILIEDSNGVAIENFVSNIRKIHDFASQVLSHIDNYSNQHTVRQGHKAVAVFNGYEALKQLSEQNFDAVLLDLQMPIMNGYVVLQKMRSDPQFLHIPVIMISAAD